MACGRRRGRLTECRRCSTEKQTEDRKSHRTLLHRKVPVGSIVANSGGPCSKRRKTRKRERRRSTELMIGGVPFQERSLRHASIAMRFAAIGHCAAHRRSG